MHQFGSWYGSGFLIMVVELSDRSMTDGVREVVKAIHTQRDAVFPIHLWEDRTRGEQWVPAYNRESFVLVNDDFLRTTSNNAVDSGRRTFEFRAMQPGTHRLVFEKRLGWKFTAEDRRVFLIEVAGPGVSGRDRE
ncbi:MAG: protease inhibitor I42 family protein [Nitrospiraceae bacterium]